MTYDISTLAVPQRENFLHISGRPGFTSIDSDGEIDSFLEKLERMEVRTVVVLMPEEELARDFRPTRR